MDPLSITGSSAGLISLGLTVSSGLIRFCRDYRHYDEDIANLGRHATHFEAVLNLLDPRLQGLQDIDPSLENLVRECSVACDRCLKDFKHLAAKYSSKNAGHGIVGRGKAAMLKLQYPFEKGQLDDIRAQLRNFQADISGLVLLLNLDATSALRNVIISGTTRLESSLIGAERRLTEHISDIAPKLDVCMDRVENSLRTRLGQAEGTICTTFQADFRGLSEQVGGIAKQSDGERALMHSVGQTLDYHGRMLVSIQDAVLAQSQSRDEDFTHQGRQSLYHNMAQRNRPGKSLRSRELPRVGVLDWPCTCSSVISPSTLQPAMVVHEPGCILLRSPVKKKLTAMVRLPVFGHLLQGKLRVEFDPRAWARDLQVYPCFSMRATVPEDAPAFKIVDDSQWTLAGYHSAEEAENVLARVLVRLQQVFENGDGSPTDLDPNGRNLLHYALCSLYAKFTTETANIFFRYLRGLIKMGVPLNDDNLEMGTPLDTLLSFNALHVMTFGEMTYVQVATELVNLGAEISDLENGRRPMLKEWFTSLMVPLIGRRFPTLMEAFGCGPLSQAILFQAETKVRDLVRTRRSSILERTYLGQSPLHLAVCWPQGIEILLSCCQEDTDSLLKCLDENGRSPLTYALMLKQPVSVKMLIDAGSDIDLNDMALFRFPPLESGSSQSDEVIQVLVERLAMRRREMLRIAIACLPEDEIDKIGIKKDSLLDDKAFEVKEALSRFGFPLSPHCQTVQPGSVYHSPYMSPVLAQKLLEAGFEDANITINGYTPIMVTDVSAYCSLSAYRERMEGVLDLTAWFEAQGADLNKPVPQKFNYLTVPISERNDSKFRVVHRVAYYLGEFAHRQSLSSINVVAMDNVSVVDRKRICLLTDILENTQKDPCICFCANGGCTPASLFARGVWEESIRWALCGTQHPSTDMYIDDLRPGIKLVDFVTEPYEIRNIATAVIRVTMFSALGMKHTCCRWVERPQINLCPGHTEDDALVKVMDPADIQDIQEEDRYLASRLDTLVEEFTAKFIEMGVPFSQFFDEYLWERILEIGREREEISANELDAMREIGVVIEEE